MQAPKETNAITIRIEHLQQLYAAFHTDPSAKLCHWFIRNDELDMINAFYTLECTDEGKFNDLFLLFQSPFETFEEYAAILLEELEDDLKNNQNDLALNDVSPNFDFRGPKTPELFWNNLNQFAQNIPSLKGSLVVYLAPHKIDDFALWEDWLASSLERGLPAKIKIMIAQIDEVYEFKKLNSRFKNIVHRIVPDLNMPDAMLELAATGNPSDPGVQFRMLYVEMLQKVNQGNITKAKELGAKALKIAEQQPEWEHLEMGIHAAIGTMLLPHKLHQKEARESFEKAFKIAKQAYDNQHVMGETILIQGYSLKGAMLVQFKEYNEASSIYRAMSGVASKNEKNIHFQMEAHRMAGFCDYHARKYKEAWDQHWLAFELATTKLNDNVYPSLLLYIAAGLLQCMDNTNNYDKEKHIDSTMKNIVGLDWKQQISNQKVRI